MNGVSRYCLQAPMIPNSDVGRSSSLRGTAESFWQMSAGRALVFWTSKSEKTLASDVSILIRAESSSPMAPMVSTDGLWDVGKTSLWMR